MSDDVGKRAAGEAAAALVAPGMRLGLGTGSTVAYFLDALAARGVADIAGIPTSHATARQATALGIRLLDPSDVVDLDLAVDGADELDPVLRLTKGGGGALLREKVVATMARRFVVIATVDKRVDRLGDRFPLPVEVVPFATAPVSRALEALGFTVVRHDDSVNPTDNGNVVLFCRMPGGIEDPEAMDVAISLLPGVVTSGLFIDLASSALLGDADGGVEEMTAPPVT